MRVMRARKCVCAYTLVRRPAGACHCARVLFCTRIHLRATCALRHTCICVPRLVCGHMRDSLRAHARSSVRLRIPCCATHSFHSTRSEPKTSPLSGRICETHRNPRVGACGTLLRATPHKQHLAQKQPTLSEHVFGAPKKNLGETQP